jgi:hypothetical protein
MLFEISVTPVAAGGWKVVIADETKETIADRDLRAVGDLPAFPIVPEAEGPSIEAGERFAALALAATDAEPKKYFDAFLSKGRLVGDDDKPVVTIGRYLFATLIGEPAWKSIRKAAGQQPIELALSFHAPERDLLALPWETMHDGVSFLAQQAGVSIVRRSAGPLLASKLELSSPPKVLIVVGTNTANDDIEAGVEYLHLIQGLRATNADAVLRTVLVVNASASRIELAVRHLKPDIVHFICHGGITAGGDAYLDLVANDDPTFTKTEKVFASSLPSILKPLPEIELPRIVVITACQSAAAHLTVADRTGQIATPLAAQLVKAGVPLVVGMAGRISDQACRIFTRRFYEALMADGEVAQATAAGRRAAIVTGGRTNPESTVDWALAVLYFNSTLADTRVDVTQDLAEQQWHGIAREYPRESDPPFCDRAGVFSQFDILAASDAAQIMARDEPFKALVVNVTRRDETSQYGCSRLLAELAVKAIYDGHVVCLVAQTVTTKGGAVTSADDLLERLVYALEDTISRFGLACTDCGVEGKDMRTSPAGCESCADIRAVFDLQALKQKTARDQAPLLRKAFVRVAALARARRPQHRRDSLRLILIVDDLHTMSPDAVSALLLKYMESYGLRGAPDDIRVVFGYCSALRDKNPGAIDMINSWLSKAQWAAAVDVDRFAGAEETAAYQSYLRRYRDPITKQRRPLALADASRAQTLCALQQTLNGVPSNLKSYVSIKILVDFDVSRQVFIDADDENVLANL